MVLEASSAQTMASLTDVPYLCHLLQSLLNSGSSIRPPQASLFFRLSAGRMGEERAGIVYGGVMGALAGRKGYVI